MRSPYEDILHLPHHRSEKHPPMSRADRAAQFAPFAALTGYHDAVQETARLTQPRIELDESRKELLNDRLLAALEQRVPVAITFFIPDERGKKGGRYETIRGVIRRVDPVARLIFLQDGVRIPVEEVFQIEAFTDGEELSDANSHL